MSRKVQLGVSSIDAVLAHLREAHPHVETAIITWDRSAEVAAVMGAVANDGEIVELPSRALHRLNSILHAPLVSDVLRLVYPTADLLLSGQICLRVPVDEPAWALALDHVSSRVEAGLRVAADDLVTATSVTLGAAELPRGSVKLERWTPVPALPDERIFKPVWVSARTRGRGRRVTWTEAIDAFRIVEVIDRLETVLSHLAHIREHEGAPADFARDLELRARTIIDL